MGHASLDVKVRAAKVTDASAINELIICLNEFHAQARPDLFRTSLGAPRGADFLKKVLGEPEQQVFVATKHGKVVGYAHVLIKTTGEKAYRFERRYSEIDTISVHPAAQGNGIGRKLLENALQWAESREVFDHQIAVHEFNKAARSLYERLGFAPSVIVLRRQS